MKNTSVALGSHFDDFIKAQIAQGRYNNASEVIRAGLRLLEDNESQVLALKKAIQEGLDLYMELHTLHLMVLLRCQIEFGINR